MLCPILNQGCLYKKCAWYDQGDGVCGVLGLKMEMVRLQETLDRSGGPAPPKERPILPLAQLLAPLVAIAPEVVPIVPLVVDKDIIQTVKGAVIEPTTNNPQHQASEIPPKITWGPTGSTDDNTGIAIEDNAGLKREDVGDQSTGTDSSGGENIPG